MLWVVGINMSLSMIIVCYNGTSYLAEAVEGL